MKHRAIDWLLLLAFLIGGALAWRNGRERSRLAEKHARLARLTGELPVADPAKVSVQALDTGEPLHFAWRVYYPPNYTQVLRHSDGGSGTSWAGRSSEFIARVVFREDEQGLLQVYTHFSGGSSRSSFGDKALAELLRGRWDRIRVEQLGAPKLAVLKRDQPAIVLRLTLPDDLQAEARKRLDPALQKRYVPVLYEVTLGPETSNP
jgi:hypothetical protein